MSDEELRTGTEAEILRDLYLKINSQEKAQARTDSELVSIKTGLAELSTSLKEIAGKLNAGTDWNVVLAAATVILTICGGCGWLVTEPLRDRIEKLEASKEQAHEDSRMLAVMIERSEWLKLAAAK